MNYKMNINTKISNNIKNILLTKFLNISLQTVVTKTGNVSTDLYINLVETESARDVESSEKLGNIPEGTNH